MLTLVIFGSLSLGGALPQIGTFIAATCSAADVFEIINQVRTSHYNVIVHLFLYTCNIVGCMVYHPHNTVLMFAKIILSLHKHYVFGKNELMGPVYYMLKFQ